LNVQCATCLAMTDLPPGTDPHTRTWCRCCTITGDDGQPHHHGQAAASCPGNNGVGHPGEPCSHQNPKVCIAVSRPASEASHEQPAGGLEVLGVMTDDRGLIPIGGTRPTGEDCPGGHCGAGVKGCAVCRPVIHFAVVGDPQFVGG
jgi:hypothetical protein